MNKYFTIKESVIVIIATILFATPWFWFAHEASAEFETVFAYIGTVIVIAGFGIVAKFSGLIDKI